jgi:O-antigen polymerase
MIDSATDKTRKLHTVFSFYWIRLILLASIGLFCVTLFFNNLALGWDRHINIFYFYFFAISAVLCTCILIVHSVEIRINRLDFIFLALTTYYWIQGVLMTQEPNDWDDKYLTLLCLGCLYFVFKVLLSYFSITASLYTIIILGFINTSFGLLQFLQILETNNPMFKITGFFSNPGPFAAYLVLAIPFLMLCRSRENIFEKSIFPVVLLLIILSIFLSASRAALLASIFSFLASTYYLKNGDWPQWALKYKRLGLYFFLPLTFLFLGFLFYQKSNSSLGRLLIWQVSMNIISEHWAFGIGPGQFAIQYPEYQASYFSVNRPDQFSKVAGMTYYAFNDWLQLTTEHGLCGLILFALLIYTVFSIRITVPFAQAARISILSTTLILGMFFYPMEILSIQLVFILSLAVLSVHVETGLSTVNKPINRFIIKLVALVLVVSCIFYVRQLYLRYDATLKWRYAYTISTFDKMYTLSQYKKLFPLLAYNGEFLFNYGALLVESGRPNEGEEILNKAKNQFNHIDLHLYLGNAYKAMKKFDEAEKCYIHASDMIPTRFYPKYLQTLLYKETNDTVMAKIMAKRIIDQDVKVPSTTVDQIKEEMRLLLTK